MKLLKKFKTKATVPDLEDYIGRSVQIPGEPQPIVIGKITGNIGMTLGRKAADIRPQFYQINDKYLISMLRFHAQMTGARDITEEEFKAFEDMEFYVEKSHKEKQIK